MKRRALILAVLFMTVPAMAVSNVTITCEYDGNEVTVSYESDANLIRGFGLDIAVTDANITKVWWDPNGPYRIFPGQIEIEYGEVTDYNYPYESDDLGDANVTIEMGSLYTWDTNYIDDANAGYGKEPNLSGVLLKFYVDKDEYCWVITENAARGGIVMEDPEEEPNVSEPNLCSGCAVITCTVPDVVGMVWTAAVTAIEDANLVASPSGVWDAVNPKDIVVSQNPTDGGTQVDCGSTVYIVVSRGPEPPNPIPDDGNYPQQHTDAATYITNHWDPNSGSGGWGKKYHCVGDCAGDTSGMPFNYRVYYTDLTIFLNSWMKKMGPWPTGANPAADIDHKSSGPPFNYRVYYGDLNRFLCYWMKKDADIGIPGPCPMPDTANNTWVCPW